MYDKNYMGMNKQFKKYNYNKKEITKMNILKKNSYFKLIYF